MIKFLQESETNINKTYIKNLDPEDTFKLTVNGDTYIRTDMSNYAINLKSGNRYRFSDSKVVYLVNIKAEEKFDFIK